MPIAIQHTEAVCFVRLDGAVTLACAEELKTRLIEGLSTGKDLELDLEHAESVDVPILQLLSAAAREASRNGHAVKSRLSAATAHTMRDSGFDAIPLLGGGELLGGKLLGGEGTE